MKILVLAHYYPPEMGGAAARLHGLSRWMAAQGNDVTVITSFPNYPSGQIPPRYKDKFKVREQMDGVDLVLTWIYASSHRSNLRRLANYFSFVFSSMIVGLFLRGNYDVILASSPPLFLGISGWVISRFRRIPFVFDIRDLWPDVAIEAGEFAPNSLMTRTWYALANFLYRRATHITPVTDNKRKKLVAAGVPSTKMTVVTNGVDLDLVPSPLPPDKRKELGLENKLVVLYAGLMGRAQGVGIAIHAAKQLRDQPNIHFLLVGDGVERELLLAKVAEFDLKNVTMLPRQPREEIPRFMATADICLVPLVSSDLVDAVPSKLLEGWAFGKLVILAAGGEAAAIVRQSNGGLVVSPEDPDQLTTAVSQLDQDREQLAACGANGYAYVCEHYDRKVLAQQMAAVLQNVCAQ